MAFNGICYPKDDWVLCQCSKLLKKTKKSKSINYNYCVQYFTINISFNLKFLRNGKIIVLKEEDTDVETNRKRKFFRRFPRYSRKSQSGENNVSIMNNLYIFII